MNPPFPSSRPLAAVGLLLLAQPASAAIVSVTVPVNAPITDANATGLASSTDISLPPSEVLSVQVTINLQASPSNAFGDLYAYLHHDSGAAILLNRPGRSTDLPFGYLDSGPFTVTFDDSASNGDIHQYRVQLFGNPNTALGASGLTGAWAPDGRLVDPSSVLNTDPRTRTLNQFVGSDPNGSWTLFVADLASPNAHAITSWTLTLDVTPVPEPPAAALATALALAAAATCLRRPRH